MANPLLEVEVAWKMIQDQARCNEVERVSLANSVGRVLTDSLVSDINSPPFSKSIVDGFAISQWKGPGERYTIVESITAGVVPEKVLTGLQATKIMTGCPVPQGTGGVIMVEESKEENGFVDFTSETFREGQNVLPEAKVIGAGQELISSGRVVESHHIGALAEFGLTHVNVFKKTTVAVLTTGDELVDPSETPGPGQIRNSNGALLCSLANAAGADVIELGIGRDNKEDLNEKIREGLNADVLVIAGGVSAGVLDLIPQCLAENHVQQIFHKIDLKPGKPLWFGKSPNGCLVFGLPGNPVSSLVCFKLFAEPTIRRLASPESQWLKVESGKLGESFRARPGRRTFWPVEISRAAESCTVIPLDWKGSADQVSFIRANGLMDLKDHSGLLETGTTVPVVRF